MMDLYKGARRPENFEARPQYTSHRSGPARPTTFPAKLLCVGLDSGKQSLQEAYFRSVVSEKSCKLVSAYQGISKKARGNTYPQAPLTGSR